MKKTRILAMVLAIVFTLCLAGCGGSSGGDNAGTANRPITESTGAAAGVGSPELSEHNQPAGRKIIYTADLSIECTDLAESLAAIEQAVADAGGYIQSSDISEYGTRHYAYLTVRIPADRYQAFVAGAGAFGNVTHRGEDTQDVTLEYVDVEARLSSLEGQRERLLAMRDEAADLDTLLRIERELADVQYQLESYTSQLNALENQVSYCTVNFDLSQPVVMSPSADDFGAKVGTAFARGVNNFIEFVQDLVLWVVENVFFLLLAAVVVTAVLLLRKKNGKRGRKRGKKKPDAPDATPPQETT